jgi:hypothetical protein
MDCNKENYSKELVEALLQENKVLFQLLSTEQTNDVCDLVRDIVSKLSDVEQQKISMVLNKTLQAIYDKCSDFKNRMDLNEEQVFLIKENLIYYIGRLGNEQSNEIITKCYYNEDNDLNKMNLAFSACLLGNQEVELDFISKVTPGSKFDLLMRSWTMAFFKNSINPHEYVDDENDDWSIAKYPRIKRLRVNIEGQKGYKKAMHFRLFDLTVLYLFCKNRAFEDLTAEEYEVIKNCTSISSIISEKKREKIEDIKVKIINRR